jgi:hypothetical protein
MIVGIVEDKFQNFGYQLSFKINFLRSNMGHFPENLTSFNA